MSTAPHPAPEARTITIDEFEAHCLELIDEASEKRMTLTVMRGGKPLGSFVPVEPIEKKPLRSLFGLTPGNGTKVPDEQAWRSIKDGYADEWDASTDRLARQLAGDFSEE